MLKIFFSSSVFAEEEELIVKKPTKYYEGRSPYKGAAKSTTMEKMSKLIQGTSGNILEDLYSVSSDISRNKSMLKMNKDTDATDKTESISTAGHDRDDFILKQLKTNEDNRYKGSSSVDANISFTGSRTEDDYELPFASDPNTIYSTSVIDDDNDDCIKNTGIKMRCIENIKLRPVLEPLNPRTFYGLSSSHQGSHHAKVTGKLLKSSFLGEQRPTKVNDFNTQDISVTNLDDDQSDEGNTNKDCPDVDQILSLSQNTNASFLSLELSTSDDSDGNMRRMVQDTDDGFVPSSVVDSDDSHCSFPRQLNNIPQRQKTKPVRLKKKPERLNTEQPVPVNRGQQHTDNEKERKV